MKGILCKLFASLLLLTFILETAAAVGVAADPGSFSAHYRIEHQKSNLGICSWISEVNEGTSDDKGCSVATLAPKFVLHGALATISKVKAGSHRTFNLFRHQQILRLICRLTI